MTCIVAIEHDGVVWMGGDSRAVCCSTLDQVISSEPKVFRVGEYLIGHTGGQREQQALHYGLELPFVLGRHGLPMPHLCGVFMDAVKAAMIKYGATTVKDGVTSYAHFLLGFRGRVYEVESDCGIIATDRGYASVGCGAPYALGALATMHDLYNCANPQHAITVALQAAERHNAGVGAPFTVCTLRSEIP